MDGGRLALAAPTTARVIAANTPLPPQATPFYRHGTGMPLDEDPSAA